MIETAHSSPLLMTLRLPWPPSVNRYWRAIPPRKGQKHARVILSTEARKFRSMVVEIFREVRCHQPLRCRLAVSVELRAPTRRKLDIDNRIKGLLDALEYAGVIANDEQVDALFIHRGPIRKGGEAIVEIRELVAP